VETKWLDQDDINRAVARILKRTGQRVVHWKIELRPVPWDRFNTKLILHALLEDGKYAEEELK
jgi:hypothetical protein